MKVMIHDLSADYTENFRTKFDSVIEANGKYGFCIGCYHCWTKHPGECFMNDFLKEFGSLIGKADELVIVSRNCYGSYSPEVKTVLERGIGASKPTIPLFSRISYHVTRYGNHHNLKAFVYGDITEEEKNTFGFMVSQTAVNYRFDNNSFEILKDVDSLKEMDL